MGRKKKTDIDKNAEGLVSEEDPNLKVGGSFDRTLLVNLTGDEKEKLHDELAVYCTDIEAKMGEKAAAMAEFNESLRDMRKGMRTVLNAINTGSREVEVKCREYTHFKNNTVIVKRLDTGEVIEERAMTAEERQQEMFALEGGPDESEGLKASISDIGEAKKKREAEKGVDKQALADAEDEPLPPDAPHLEEPQYKYLEEQGPGLEELPQEPF